MTEVEWLASSDPAAMLAVLKGRASDRKRRLFAVASCRLVLANFPNDRCRDAADAAERFADGLIGDDEFRSVHEAVLDTRTLIFAQDFEGCALARVVSDMMRVPVVVNPARGSAPLLRDILGNPFRPVTPDPAWLTPTAVGVARHIYDGRVFHDLPVLADALQDTGCDDAAILGHCRGDGPHARGCWVVDLVLWKA